MDSNTAEVIQIGLVSSTFLIAFAIFMFTRRRSGKVAPFPLDQLSARLERIEQSVDTIAIEIERVSEGQRFTSKLLAERESHGVPAKQITPH